MHANQAGQYVLSIGVLAVVEQSRPGVICRWDAAARRLHLELPEEDLLNLLCDAAAESSWRSSLEPTGVVPLAQTGRRDLCKWVHAARSHLATLPPADRLAELRGVLLDEAVRYSAPQELKNTQRSQGAALYGCGTLWPAASRHDAWGGDMLSAWHAALAWEAKDWLSYGQPIKTFADSPGWHSSQYRERVGYWWTPIWTDPLSIAEARETYFSADNPAEKSQQQHQSGEGVWIPYLVGSLLGGRTFELYGPAENTARLTEKRFERAARVQEKAVTSTKGKNT